MIALDQKRIQLFKEGKSPRQRVKTGDVIAIPFGEQFAFGVIMDEDIAVFAHLGNSIEDLPTEKTFLMVVHMYTCYLTSGELPKIGKMEITEEEINFACVFSGYTNDESYFDLESKSFYSKHDSFTILATKEQCFGFERSAVYSLEHILIRLTHTLTNSFNEILKRDLWVPFGLDLTHEFKRVPVEELVKKVNLDRLACLK